MMQGYGVGGDVLVWLDRVGEAGECVAGGPQALGRSTCGSPLALSRLHVGIDPHRPRWYVRPGSISVLLAIDPDDTRSGELQEKKKHRRRWKTRRELREKMDVRR